MSDRVDALKRFHSATTFGTRANLLQAQAEALATYRALDPAEIDALIEFALDALPTRADRTSTVLGGLACLRPGSLAAWHLILADWGVFKPGLIYHGAGGEIAARIVAELEGNGSELDRLGLNNRLLALVWVGDAVACAALARWRADPPAWVSGLFIPPHRYTREAGWELTEAGTRRDLVPSVCHPLVPVDGPAAIEPGAIAVVADHEGACEWCDRGLTTLLDLDLTHPILAPFDLAIGGVAQRLRLATCVVCACYGAVCTRVDGAGGSTWHPGNRRPDFLPDPAQEWTRLPERRLALASPARPAIEAAEHGSGVSCSQIGGYPTWEQDAEYPACPDCGATMTFVGQVACDDLDELSEGIYYLTLCRTCGVAATSYQQT